MCCICPYITLLTIISEPTVSVSRITSGHNPDTQQIFRAYPSHNNTKLENVHKILSQPYSSNTVNQEIIYIYTGNKYDPCC